LSNIIHIEVNITQIKKVPDSYGILSARTVQYVGGFVYYQRPDGQIMRTNGVNAQLVSDIIFPTLAGIAEAQLSTACAGTIGSYYYLSVAESGQPQNNIMIVFDTRNKGSFSIDRGKYASCFVSHPDSNGVPQIYFGDSRITSGMVYEMELGNNDNGVNFTSIVNSGVVISGDIYSSDLLRDILAVVKATPGATFTIGYTGWSNTNTFKTQTFSIDTGASKWGLGTWGDGRIWGGSSEIEQIFRGVYLTDRGFKFTFTTVPSTGTVQFVLLALTLQPITDNP